jgi:hypothetical protein
MLLYTDEVIYLNKEMKKSICALILLSSIYLSSCQKNSVAPEIKPSQTDQKATVTPITLNQGDGTSSNDTSLNNINGSLKVQLTKDTINTDNIFISFNPAAKTIYVPGEDAPSFQGFGHVSLASLSSDNIPLAINVLPLTQKGLTIGLKVNATNDGIYKLEMLSINSIPPVFKIWLKDNYKKDSIDYRKNPSYAFNIYKGDTTTFGSHRFKLVIGKK